MLLNPDDFGVDSRDVNRCCINRTSSTVSSTAQCNLLDFAVNLAPDVHLALLLQLSSTLGDEMRHFIRYSSIGLSFISSTSGPSFITR